MRRVFEAALDRARVAAGTRYLDVGCGSGMAAQLTSTGNAVRAIERAGEDAVTAAYRAAIPAYRQPDGTVRASAWFRCVLARR